MDRLADRGVRRRIGARMEVGTFMLWMPWLVVLTALSCRPAPEGDDASRAREREQMVGVELKDFTRDYLVGVAGWSLS